MASSSDVKRVSPIVLRFAQLVGVGVDELCFVAKLDPRGLENGVTHAEGMLLWRALEKISGDPCIGLTAGGRVSSDSMGAIGVMFSTAEDLDSGLRVLGKALPILLQNDLQLEMSARGGEIRYCSVNEEPRHGIDGLFGAILTLARECCGHRVIPTIVELQYPAPADTTRYAAFYGVKPAFGRTACVLGFAASDLKRPFRSSDARTNELLVSHADGLVGPTPELPLHRIERAVAMGDGTLADAAERLRVSPRTLQRQLAELELTFKDLRARIHRDRALELLGRGTSVGDVATALGYASRASFSRAFQDWVGCSPMAYVTRLRASRPGSR